MNDDEKDIKEDDIPLCWKCGNPTELEGSMCINCWTIAQEKI